MTGEHDPRRGQRFIIRDNGDLDDLVWQPQPLTEAVTDPVNHLYIDVSNRPIRRKFLTRLLPAAPAMGNGRHCTLLSELSGPINHQQYCRSTGQRLLRLRKNRFSLRYFILPPQYPSTYLYGSKGEPWRDRGDSADFRWPDTTGSNVTLAQTKLK